jgi:hypothetical protein
MRRSSGEDLFRPVRYVSTSKCVWRYDAHDRQQRLVDPVPDPVRPSAVGEWALHSVTAFMLGPEAAYLIWTWAQSVDAGGGP